MRTSVHYFKQNLKLSKNEKRTIGLLFKHSAKLYNEALYLIRKHEEKYGEYLCYSKVNDYLRQNSANYALLGSSLSFSIIRNIDWNYKNYFKSRKNMVNNNKIDIPKFRKHNFFIYFFKSSISNNKIFKIHLTNKFKEKYEINEHLFIDLAKRIQGKEMKSIRLQQHLNNRYFLVAEYYDTIQQERPFNGNILGIDFGMENLFSCYPHHASKDLTPFIIKGSYVMFQNYKYFLSLKEDKSEEELKDILIKRKNKIDAFLNRSIKYIFRYCHYMGINTVVVGEFLGIKDKAIAKNFYFIPYHVIKNKFRMEAKRTGVQLIFTEESYTSKASFYHKDPLNASSTKSGSRVKRGLYKIQEKKYVNADINGAANIIRKKFEINCKKSFFLNPRIITL